MTVFQAKIGGFVGKLSKTNLENSIETEQEDNMNWEMRYWSLSREVLRIIEWSWRRWVMVLDRWRRFWNWRESITFINRLSLILSSCVHRKYTIFTKLVKIVVKSSY